MRVIDFDLPRDCSDSRLSGWLATFLNEEGQLVQLKVLPGSNGPWEELPRRITASDISLGLRSGRWKQLALRPTKVRWKKDGRVLQGSGKFHIYFTRELVGVRSDGTVPIFSPRVQIQPPGDAPFERRLLLDRITLRPNTGTADLQVWHPY